MSLDLALVAAMGGALVFTAWMWVPPRRSSGLEPNHAQAGGADRDEPPRRIEPFIEPPVDFAGLVTVGALEERPIPPRVPSRLRAVPTLGVQSGELRRSAVAEVTPEQKRAILLAVADDLGDEDSPATDVPATPSSRTAESGPRPARIVKPRDGVAPTLRAAGLGLVRLDGGVCWVGVEPDHDRVDTLPPAAVEDDL